MKNAFSVSTDEPKGLGFCIQAPIEMTWKNRSFSNTMHENISL